MVVGWQLAEHLRTSLVTDALAMAVTAGHAPPGAVFHSDRGAQYTSAEFARFCADNRIHPSVGRTGVCWDNAGAESFFATLKNEMYYRQRFDTRAEARFAVAEYIETASGCIPAWATAPRTKRSPTTRPDPRPDQHTCAELSKILGTAQASTTMSATRAGSRPPCGASTRRRPDGDAGPSGWRAGPRESGMD
jgi:hypothetical protein